MEKRVFDFQDYKAFLRTYIRSQPGKGRGFRARMADTIHCQRGFITKVLAPGNSTDLSLEQAEKLNSLLNHSEGESTFFLLLVQYARAGTEGLRNHVRNQMKAILNRRLSIQKEMQSKSFLSPEDHMQYYSAWYYSAIRVSVSIPSLQTREALAKRLKLPMATVVSALEFLVSRGLIDQKGDRYTHSQKQQILLPADHPMTGRHHANWRVKAIASLEQQPSQDLHYSYLVSLSENDALQLRSFLVETVKEFIARAAPSKEETLYSICLDYFEV